MGSVVKGLSRIYSLLWFMGSTGHFTKLEVSALPSSICVHLSHLFPNTYPGSGLEQDKIPGLRTWDSQASFWHHLSSLYTSERADVFTIATESSCKGCKLVPDSVRTNIVLFYFYKKLIIYAKI